MKEFTDQKERGRETRIKIDLLFAAVNTTFLLLYAKIVNYYMRLLEKSSIWREYQITGLLTSKGNTLEM